jgi:predicted MFS family arabinose efflux permease
MTHGKLPIAAVILVGAIGELILYVGPVLLGAAVDAFGFSPGDAGYIVAGEYGLSAAAAIYLSSLKTIGRVKTIVALSILLLIVCDGISFITSSPAVFIACRLIVAFGAGALFAIGNRAAAEHPKSQRLFSMMIFVAVLFSAFVYSFAPESIVHFGPRGPFGLLVLISLIMIPFIAFFPELAPAQAQRRKAGAPVAIGGVAMLAAIFMLYGSNIGLWAYVERIGQAQQLSIEAISLVLTLNGFIALGAGLLAAIMGVRFGAFAPITIAILVQMVSAYVLPIAPGVTTYGALAISFTFGLIFVVPYLKAVLADIDNSGRLAGLGTALITLGSAFGPAIMGFALNEGAGYRDLALITSTGLVIAWALSVVSLRGRRLQALSEKHH